MVSMEMLRESLQPSQWQEAEQLVSRGQVRELRQVPGLAEYMITQEPYPLVRLRASLPSQCDCGEDNCQHLAAALISATHSGALQTLESYREKQASAAFFDAVESLLPEAPSLQIEPSLFIDQKGLSLSLRVGESRLYVVRHVPRFLKAMAAGERIEITHKLFLSPQRRSFGPAADLLRLLTGYVQALEQGGSRLSPAQARKLPIQGETALWLLEALKGLRFRLTASGQTRMQEGIEEGALPAIFYVTGGRNGIRIQARMEQPCALAAPDGSHILVDGRLTRLKPQDRAMARVLLGQEERDFFFPPALLPQLTGELLPNLMRSHAVVIDEKLERRMLRLPLKPRIYLDQLGGQIVARLRFCYGDIELDPFKLKREEPRLLLHDAVKERQVFEALAKAGFRVRKGYVYLAGEEESFVFLTEGIQELSQHAELFLSQAFKKLSPRKPSLSGRLSTQGGGLTLSLLDDDQPIEELVPILQAIRARKKYFRYKDGSFIVLEDSEAWQGFAQAALEAASQGQQDLRDLSSYRAAYLHSLIEAASLPVAMDEGTEALFRMEEQPAESPVQGLHAYQLRGFRWLNTLHRLRMGGILADEMGLGKTVQTIAAIAYAKQTEVERLPSIVVMPTTLTYNWLSEFKRFAPQLSVQIIAGARQRRRAQIEAFSGPDAPDVLLTSYPLIRQDIDLLREIPFRYAVLDEGQFIKNSLSLSARAVKRLQAQTRIALTGTPLENNVAELWSLFDFVLPGYLPNLREFLRRYDQGKNAEDLLRRIRPFLMRRLKKEVMAELPDKIESLISVPMPPEQRKVYLAVMAQKRMRLEGLLERGQVPGSGGELLSALMEMRQICCHPALVLPGYTQEAGKMELLSDILPEAIQDGHRVLIFSQFTQMLKILRRRLNQEGIETLYLDGETKPKERQELTERFNQGAEPVFLISLKAGGTGLNLTGADMVIHYDPWWNPSAEDQAADRAHRLGQKKSVQVLRLVMHDSIEEQVLALSQSKRKLFERLIQPGEALPEKLKRDDILRLFSVGDQEIDEDSNN